ncbi:MAG: Zn-ribbon domain-containing OB-fold protein [Acidimicrobiia bacterium]
MSAISGPISDDELVAMFAHLGIDRDSAAHFRGRLDHRLLVNRCADCGVFHHPSRPVCPRCWSSAVVPTEVAGTGTIHLLTFLHQGPPAPGVDYSTPYPLVTVELDEQVGLRFTATVVGSPNESIAIGERVELRWIERAGVPVPAFALVGSTAS